MIKKKGSYWTCSWRGSKGQILGYDSYAKPKKIYWVCSSRREAWSNLYLGNFFCFSAKNGNRKFHSFLFESEAKQNFMSLSIGSVLSASVNFPVQK